MVSVKEVPQRQFGQGVIVELKTLFEGERCSFFALDEVMAEAYECEGIGRIDEICRGAARQRGAAFYVISRHGCDGVVKYSVGFVFPKNVAWATPERVERLYRLCGRAYRALTRALAQESAISGFVAV